MSEDGTNPDLFVDEPHAGDPQAGAAVPAATTPTPLSAGAQLAQLRQARGWSVVEVADQLNLAPRQVQALEDENYAALPGPAITRGFIRAYAKLLKVDPTALLAGMSATPPTTDTIAPARRPLPQTHYSDNRLNAVSSRQSGSKWYMALLGLVLLIGALALAQYENWLPGDVAKSLAKLSGAMSNLHAESAVKSAESDVTGAQVIAPSTAIWQSGSGVAADAGSRAQNPDAAQIDGVGRAASLTPAPQTPVERNSAGVAPAPPMPASATAPSVQQPANLAAAAAAAKANANANATVPDTSSLAPTPTVAAGANQLVLNFRQDSWVELKGRGKNTVASKLYRAGTTASFDVTEPVQLLVGNAAGVDATLRGAALALPSIGKNNVARLIVK